MVRAPVDPVHNCVGRAFQLIKQTSLDQSSEDRFWRLVAVKGEAGDVGLAVRRAQRGAPF
jgi:hypothetical protein